MPEPDVWLESNKGEPKLWGCVADIDDPEHTIAHHVDRKIAICEAALALMEKEKRALNP